MQIHFKRETFWLYSLVTIYIALILNVTYSWMTISFYSWLPMLVVIPGLLMDLLRIVKRQKIRKSLVLTVRLFVLPFVIPTVISIFTAHSANSRLSFNQSIINQSIRNAVFVISAILLGYYLIQIFGKNLIMMILMAGTISYITVIIQVICKHIGIFTNLIVEGAKLEVHILTYLYGMLFLLFLLDGNLPLQWRKIGGLICGIGIVLGNKRALYLGLGVSLGVYFLFRKILHNKSRGVIVFAILCCIGALLWIYLIHNGSVETFMLKYHIDDNFRLYMWNYFENDYSFSLAYWGRGLCYTDIIIGYDHLFSRAITLHNDILRFYIGWGFLPFCYFIFSMTYSRVKSLLKVNRMHNAWIYLSIILTYFLINFFGNTFTSIGAVMLVYVLWYYLYYCEEGKP